MPNPVGRRIRSAREAAGMSQSDLARRLGISRGHMSNVEHGWSAPSVALVERIARVIRESGYAVSGNYLLGLTPDMANDDTPALVCRGVLASVGGEPSTPEICACKYPTRGT